MGIICAILVGLAWYNNNLDALYLAAFLYFLFN